MSSEFEKLTARIEKMYEQGMRNIHIDWGPEADKLTKEERAKAINDWLDEADKWGALSAEEKMRSQIKDVYDELKKGIKLCQTDVREWRDAGFPEKTEDQKKLSQLFGILDMALLILGNWVPRDVGSK